MRKVTLALAAATMALPAAMPAPAFAQSNGGYYQGRTWVGQDGRTYCRKRNGTVGTIVGGAAGALVGRAIDNRGSRVTGTVLGAAAGALLGREIQKSRGFRCR